MLAAGLNLCSSFGQWNTRISSRRLGFLVDIPGYSCLGETSNMFTPRSYVNNWYSSLSLVGTSVACLEAEKSLPEVLPTSCCQQLVLTVTVLEVTEGHSLSMFSICHVTTNCFHRGCNFIVLLSDPNTVTSGFGSGKNSNCWWLPQANLMQYKQLYLYSCHN